MSEDRNEASGIHRALLVVQSAMNRLIEDGVLTKPDILEAINDVFSPPLSEAPTVVVEHPSDAHAILSSFVSGLKPPPEAPFQPTMEI